MMYLFKERSEEWLKFRHNYITATEGASLLGLNSYKSGNQLLKEKLDPASIDKVDNHHMRDGRGAEELVIKLLQEDGFVIHRLAPHGSVLVFTDELDYFSSTPDSFIWENNKACILEIKKVSDQEKFKQYWLGNNYPPLRYLVQAQVQLLTTGLDKAFLCCTTFENNIPIAVHEITFNKFFAQLLLDKAMDFRLRLKENSKYTCSKKIREESIKALYKSTKFSYLSVFNEI